MTDEMDIFYDAGALAEITAEKLTGRGPIYLRGRAPAVTTWAGATQKVKGLGYFIDIKQDQDPIEQLITFLHETAHIKLHPFTELETPHDADPGTVEFTEEEKAASREARADEEREAIALADQWLKFADKWHKNAPGGALESRLRVLYDDWTDTEYSDERMEIYFKTKDILQGKR